MASGLAGLRPVGQSQGEAAVRLESGLCVCARDPAQATWHPVQYFHCRKKARPVCGSIRLSHVLFRKLKYSPGLGLPRRGLCTARCIRMRGWSSSLDAARLALRCLRPLLTQQLLCGNTRPLDGQ